MDLTSKNNKIYREKAGKKKPSKLKIFYLLRIHENVKLEIYSFVNLIPQNTSNKYFIFLSRLKHIKRRLRIQGSHEL